MTNIREYPVMDIKLPADLVGVPAGKLPEAILRPLKGFPAGKMHHKAATAFNCLQLAAFFAGIELMPVSAGDCYRSYDAQMKLFLSRYEQAPTGRTPEVTRKFEGKTWYLKKGVAPAGTPGSSNHNSGLAVDIRDASGKRLDWMIGDQNIPFGGGSPVVQYGFSWEVKDPKNPNAESWHIRYCSGDTWTPKVEEMLKAFPDLKA